MRRGEMLALNWCDVDTRPGWLHLRCQTTKSGKSRVGTGLDDATGGSPRRLRLDASGGPETADALVFSNTVGAPIRYFKRRGWPACRTAGVPDLRWHDLQ